MYVQMVTRFMFDANCIPCGISEDEGPMGPPNIQMAFSIHVS